MFAITVQSLAVGVWEGETVKSLSVCLSVSLKYWQAIIIIIDIIFDEELE